MIFCQKLCLISINSLFIFEWICRISTILNQAKEIPNEHLASFRVYGHFTKNSVMSLIQSIVPSIFSCSAFDNDIQLLSHILKIIKFCTIVGQKVPRYSKIREPIFTHSCQCFKLSLFRSIAVTQYRVAGSITLIRVVILLRLWWFTQHILDVAQVRM